MHALTPARIVITAALWLLAVPSQVSAMDPPGYTAPYAETLETLNFPLIAILHALPDWSSDLVADPALAALSADRAARVREAKECSKKPVCLADAWVWTAEDIAVVEAAFRSIIAKPGRARALVAEHMRPSRRFARHGDLPDAELLVTAWADTVAGLNNIIAIYAKGMAPRYPLIDSMIFDAEGQGFTTGLDAHSQVTAQSRQDADLVFDASVQFAAGLLRMNERMNAANYRPVLAAANASAIAVAERTIWSDYRYPALLVFGQGPEDLQSRTGPMSYIRMAWAGELFARELAPFIIVSGGNVHPDRTAFNEAIEMKRILITHHGVPENRILIEPHARHTTTNLRNSARLLFAAGFPTNRPSLVVTDPNTAQYIGSARLIERAREETGIIPGRVSSSDTPFAFEFLPDIAAFHVEPLDPLDP